MHPAAAYRHITGNQLGANAGIGQRNARIGLDFKEKINGCAKQNRAAAIAQGQGGNAEGGSV
jgi:hypothetical protein